MSATTTDTVVEMQHGDVINLSSLPTELLFELALRSPIRALRCVVRFDARLVACVRLQRWYRRFEAPVDTCLSVGDRVLVRGASANLPRLQYATVAAQMRERDLWKVQLLNDEYANVPSSRIHRLQEWGDGPRTGSVALSAAVASASRARGAATHATAAAVLAMHADASSAQTALVIAAATAASTAAAAAAVASSAVAPVATNDMQHAQEVGELLLAANRMREAILATQGGAIALAPVACPSSISAFQHFSISVACHRAAFQHVLQSGCSFSTAAHPAARPHPLISAVCRCSRHHSLPAPTPCQAAYTLGWRVNSCQITAVLRLAATPQMLKDRRVLCTSSLWSGTPASLA